VEVENRFSVSARRMSRSIIRELLKLTNKPGLISFAGGLPNPGTFPRKELSEICAEILEEHSAVALQYGATEGLAGLRDQLLGFLAGQGLRLSREQLVITSASQQSLDLVGRVFLDRGDTVITENPSYLGAISAFKTYGVRFLTVDMDGEGLRTELLRAALQEQSRTAGSGAEYYQNMPKLIYTVPDFQNPSGLTLSLQRRRELLELAEEFDQIIVEDVPYRWLRYSGEELPLLSALEAQRPGFSGPSRVIGLFTFSKILSPGIRLGWVTAAPAVIDKIVQAKQAADLCTSCLSQMIAEQFMRRGLLQRRIAENIELYRRRCQAMVEALERELPQVEGLRWYVPHGGLFLWLELPPGMDTEEMFGEAIERDVAYVVGSAFFPNGGGHNTMRLNFSFPSEEEIAEGIRRLAGLIASRL
jgi:2-aminoadipate transaminase